jgi:hypothetical protein
MIAAIFRHIILIFTFRHDGRGLPAHGPVPYLLLSCSALFSYIRGVVETGSTITSLVLVALGYLLVLLAGKKKPHLIAPIALVCLGGDSLSIVALLYDFGVMATLITLWQVAAIVGYVTRRHSSN